MGSALFWSTDTGIVYSSNQVRNESAENFLSLLKEWQELCSYFSLVEKKVSHEKYVNLFSEEDDDTSSNEEVNSEDDNELNEDDEIFEVSEILAVCYGDPNKKKEQGLYFKVVIVEPQAFFPLWL